MNSDFLQGSVPGFVGSATFRASGSRILPSAREDTYLQTDEDSYVRTDINVRKINLLIMIKTVCI